MGSEMCIRDSLTATTARKASRACASWLAFRLRLSSRFAADLLGQGRCHEGIEIAEDAMAEKISGKAGAIEVTTKDGRVFKGSHLLMAVGRKTNTDKLNLEAAGIETTRTGIKVDDGLRTTNRKVYAIGDVAGGLQFTHVAGYLSLIHI